MQELWQKALLPTIVFGPMVCAVVGYGIGRVSKRGRNAFVMAALLLLWGLSLGAYLLRDQLQPFSWPGFAGMGLTLTIDGFRGLYVLVACTMWLVTGVFSLSYFSSHYRNRNRYWFFTLLTLCGTVGMLLSESLYGAFVFFEIMSMSSYAWVAHDEKKGALRAAQTYMAVAVIGGMVTLMGLMLLYAKTGTLSVQALSGMREAFASERELYTAGALIAFGFLCKAGAFPVHIWLPKAHPVAPAPASALLSGMLTKCGVFGLLALSSTLFFADAVWGNALLLVGLVTMVIGAVLALFSTDLKRTLACSSMSQIGFILTGVGCMGILGHHGGLAGLGTVGHMLNHSACKLLLFQCAGAVYMRLHRLELSQIAGFGRKKPLLHAAFLLGALGLAGLPGLNGYLSKSLLHEGLLEVAQVTGRVGLYRTAEWVFLVSGGMTAAYMAKLYICLFLEKNADPALQARYDAMPPFDGYTKLALSLSAVLLPLMGLLPDLTLGRAAELSLPFLGQHAPAHGVHWFSLENLQGAAISLSIGAALYGGFVQPVLCRGGYRNLWPQKLDMEEALYRPLCTRLLPGVGHLLARVGDGLAEFVLMHMLKPVTLFFTRVADVSVDAVAAGLWSTLFRRPRTEKRPLIGSRFTYGCGVLCNGCIALVNATLLRAHPIDTDCIALFAAWRDEMGQTMRRVTRSVSFGLLLLCLTIYCIFAILLR